MAMPGDGGGRKGSWEVPAQPWPGPALTLLLANPSPPLMVYSPFRLWGFTPARVPSLFQTTRKAHICLLSPLSCPPPNWLHWPSLTLRLITEVPDTSLSHPPKLHGTYEAFCKVPLGRGETEALPSPAGGGGVPQTPTFLLHMLSTPGSCSACLS